MSRLEFKPQDRQSIDFAEEERIRFENNGKKDRAVVDASNLSAENKESWQKAVSLLKGAICMQTNFDQAISGSSKKIEFQKQVSSVGSGVSFSGNSFVITGDDVTCIKFTIDCNFYNMSGVAYYEVKPRKNGANTGDSLWFFYDSGHSGGFSQTIMFNCKKGDVFEFFGQTLSSTSGYLNGNTYITVEVF